jgi:hypothetical protein
MITREQENELKRSGYREISSAPDDYSTRNSHWEYQIFLYDHAVTGVERDDRIVWEKAWEHYKNNPKVEKPKKLSFINRFINLVNSLRLHYLCFMETYRIKEHLDSKPSNGMVFELQRRSCWFWWCEVRTFTDLASAQSFLTAEIEKDKYLDENKPRYHKIVSGKILKSSEQPMKTTQLFIPLLIIWALIYFLFAFYNVHIDVSLWDNEARRGCVMCMIILPILWILNR